MVFVPVQLARLLVLLALCVLVDDLVRAVLLVVVIPALEAEVLEAHSHSSPLGPL